MTQAAKAQEPSMEEILASIRRIIADDDPKPAARPEPKPFEAPPAAKAPTPPPKPAPAAMKQDDIDAMLAGLDEPEPAPAKPLPAPAEDVLELTEAMQAPPSFRKIDAAQDVVFEDPEPPAATHAADRPRAAAAAPPTAETILSPATAGAVDSAFNALAQTVF